MSVAIRKEPYPGLVAAILSTTQVRTIPYYILTPTHILGLDSRPISRQGDAKSNIHIRDRERGWNRPLSAYIDRHNFGSTESLSPGHGQSNGLRRQGSAVSLRSLETNSHGRSSPSSSISSQSDRTCQSSSVNPRVSLKAYLPNPLTVFLQTARTRKKLAQAVGRLCVQMKRLLIIVHLLRHPCRSVVVGGLAP